jgi:preprotein translocase subunit SecF
MNIIKYRYWYFLISLIVIIPGMIALALWGLPLAIDFTGGSLLDISITSPTAMPTIQEIADIYNANSSSTNPVSNPIVQPVGQDGFSIRSKPMDEATKAIIVKEIEAKSGGTVAILNFTRVSPAIGEEVAVRAAGAVAVAALAILLYITYAFRGVPHAFRYGTAAIIAMLHDVLVTIGAEALLGHFLGWQADSLFLTALLTVIGFSVHDTIVVFDRIRENSNIYRKLDYEKLVNHSIVQSLDRSINTQLTVMITLTALVLFGGDSIRHFVIILLVGVFSGTYSSIFNASPILVVWEKQEWRNWFRPRSDSANNEASLSA